MKMHIKRLPNGVGLLAPSHARPGDAGLDLRSTVDRTMSPGERVMVDTGFAVEIADGYFGMVVPRSSVGRAGIMLSNTVGIIDASYRGAIKLALFNTGEYQYIIRAGDALAQLVVIPFVTVQCIEVDELSDSVRGAGGWGSTG